MSTPHAIPFFNGLAQPQDQAFDAWPDQTLLQSLEQGGMDWPSSCRNGTCRTCLSQLEGGRVRYDVEWPGLSADEKEQGCVLPCVAYPESDVVLRFLGV
ncbi:MAG: hypothetical protein Fur007_07580 [Rhodoferax sp.]